MLAQVTGSAATVISSGQVIAGASLSSTTTTKLQFADCPLAAWTWCVTMVLPRGKSAPLAGPAVRTIVAPGQLSLKEGSG